MIMEQRLVFLGTAIVLAATTFGPLGHSPCAAADLAAPSEGVVLDGETAFAAPAGTLQDGGTALTVAAWVLVEESSGAQVFVNRGAANALFTLYLYKDAVRMLVAHESGAYRFAGAPKPESGVWTHYAGTYDGQAVKVYRNGLLEATTEAPGAIAKANDPLVLGALSKRERFLKGRMDDVRVWSRVLSDSEIEQIAGGQTSPALNTGMVDRYAKAGLSEDGWQNAVPGRPEAEAFELVGMLMNEKDDGYRGIWYYNQKSNDEYVYKYSGGLGTYCAKHIPHSWYVKEVDKTFFTYGGAYKDKNRLVHMVSYYDHQTGLVPRPTMLLDKETDDAHDNPVINVDEKGHIWIFSSSHGTGRPSYISRSKEPYSVDAFDLVWTGNYSYPQPWYFPGKGWLFMHTHYTGGRAIAMTTSADGANWTPRRFLSRIAQGHYQITNAWNHEKVASAFNYHPPEKGLNWRTNLYYMETHDFGETWTSIQGEPVPILLDDVDNPALVHEYESKKLNVYMKDLNFDAQGNPIILYVTSKGYESGPENMPRTWTTARWTGSEWDIQGGDIISDNNYDTGSIYIEAHDQWRIIGPTEVGPQPYNPGGEVAMWLSRDQGKSWEMVRKMTQNSPYNHTYVRRPINAHPDFYGFWADGHGRQPSVSRLYFCNKEGDVFRLPFDMEESSTKPERVEAGN